MSAGMVIVGAGEAGARAAMALRENGFAGLVTLIGAERHAPYERPPMSKELMLAGEAVAPKTIATMEALAGAGIAFHPQTIARAIDRERKAVEFSDGRSVLYDKLLLATGANPRRLAIPRADGPNCVTLRTHDDALRIQAHLHRKDRIAIIGGGFIGLELAAAARRHGAEVTVLEALPRLLTRGVPEAIASRIETRHRAEGVGFRFGARITGIEAGGVRLEADETSAHPAAARPPSPQRGEATSDVFVPADLVIIGVGAVPETALAAAAGLTIDNGVAADRTLATSDPNIFAAGDCCSFPLEVYGGRRVRLESWRSAQDLGALAARNMLGAGEPISTVPWFWSDQYELTLQIAGLPDEGEVTAKREWNDGLVLFHLKADGRLVAASGLGIGNAVARDIRVAEMLIARRAHPDMAALSQPDFKLKSLLAA